MGKFKTRIIWEPSVPSISTTESDGFEPTWVNKGLWTLSENGTFIRCRQWRVLDSHFRFLCDGRIMASPGNPVFWIFMIIYTITTLSVFLCFDIYPEFRSDETSDYIVPIVVIIASILVIQHTLEVVLVEPGVVPRPSLEDRSNNLWIYTMVLRNQLHYTEVSQMLDGLHAGRYYEYYYSTFYSENGQRTVLRHEVIGAGGTDAGNGLTLFCERCCHFRLENVRHCDDCGCCIDHFHHHCYIFGVCIGRRNYGAFLRLLFLSNFLLTLVGYLSMSNLISHWIETDFSTAAGKSPTIFVLLSALIMPPCGLLSAAFLLMFNIYEILANKEPFGDTDKLRMPHTCGCRMTILMKRFQNLFKLMFSKYPISNTRPREIVDVVAVPRTQRQLWSEIEKENLEISARQARQAAKLEKAAKKKRKGRSDPSELALRIVEQAKPKRRSFLKRLQTLPFRCTAPRLAGKAPPARSFPPSFRLDMPTSTSTTSYSVSANDTVNAQDDNNNNETTNV